MAADETFFGLLRRLARDRRGNTLVLTAALTLPMAGLVGGGIDMSRLYLIKTRLQHACDAGALTGRKIMGAGTWSANSGAANTEAVKMFDANFKTNAYGSGTKTKAYTETGSVVTGTASVVVPMTMMKIFGVTTRTIAVTCDAEMKLPNTDVMFVLDNTGSMGETNSGDTDDKITGLKKAVKCFYEALEKVNTTADCGSTPSGGNGPVQIRFGFVPYSTNVNVGKLLPNSYFANTWPYQSRVGNSYKGTIGSTYWEVYSGGAIDQDECLAFMNNQAFSGFTPTDLTGGPPPTTMTVPTFPGDGAATQGGSTGEWGWTGSTDNSGGHQSCRRKRADVTVTNGTTGATTVYAYVYKQITQTVSGLKVSGSTWNNSVNLPIGANGANLSVPWDGCIEERQTFHNTDGDPSNEFSPIPATAYDLNIDLVPSSGTASSLWGPLLPGAVWGREDSGGSKTTSDVISLADLDRNYNYYCPTQAKKLAEYPTATSFETYVDSLFPTGNTYHDIGLLWGARLMSPTGMFGSENAFTPSGGQIQRHLIFMTDGDTNTDNQDYNAYGVPWWDRRQTITTSAPSDSLTDAEVDARFPALCTAIKNMNITLWVISYGSGTNTTTQTRLSNCASTGKYFSAANTTTLISNFQSIADQISNLRLTN